MPYFDPVNYQIANLYFVTPPVDVRLTILRNGKHKQTEGNKKSH